MQNAVACGFAGEVSDLFPSQDTWPSVRGRHWTTPEEKKNLFLVQSTGLSSGPKLHKHEEWGGCRVSASREGGLAPHSPFAHVSQSTH